MFASLTQSLSYLVAASGTVVFLLTAAPNALASPVTWSFSNLAFGDGGTASGSFVYDASTNAFTDIAISTTVGSVRLGTTYDNATGTGDASTADFIDPALPVVIGVSERLVFSLATPMTDSGGDIVLLQLLEFTCVNVGCTFVSDTEPDLNLRRAAGSITSSRTVSEPASLTLVGLLLCAAGAFFRRTGR